MEVAYEGLVDAWLSLLVSDLAAFFAELLELTTAALSPNLLPFLVSLFFKNCFFSYIRDNLRAVFHLGGSSLLTFVSNSLLAGTPDLVSSMISIKVFSPLGLATSNGYC